MSHFTVAILTKNKPSTDQLDEILGPYCEDTDVAAQYGVASWEDKTDQLRIDWEKEDEEVIARFPSFDDYVEEYCGAHRIPKKSDRWGYLCNPDAKWDWYQIGGRWANSLCTTDRSLDYILGTESWRASTTGRAPTGEEIWVNGCYVKDLIDKPDQEGAAKARAEWKKGVKEEPLNAEEEAIVGFLVYKKEYYLEHFQTEENYVDYCSKFSTFAVIDEKGVWHEGGEMGWFGCYENHDEKRWQQECRSLIFDNLEQDTERYITIVDCHI